MNIGPNERVVPVRELPVWAPRPRPTPKPEPVRPDKPERIPA